jgi:antibiotic biosynthesis monooxygenase (ABM) superfamily enzyme
MENDALGIAICIPCDTLLFPLIQEFNQLIKTLILTMILVPLMGIVLPKLHHRFAHWLRR